ncbi:hypothetical protein AALP_AA5G281700 [Arabis alpina]|uniref:WRKY domain-containing protein n=1 Tax=Arabis alpina TaxID=50452 RepID=A0A087GZW5_ARAAL|nr:hypothetical protein AALP_AA5G281700 [Arabis alpina]
MENIDVGMPFCELGKTRAYSSFSDLSAERYPVGFMELLGVPQGISRYANMHLPATPNSSSILSTSREAENGDEKKRDYEEDDEEEEEEEKQKSKRKRRVKSTKSKDQTKIRVPKVSFITKSVVDNLDDGYKWRKYGQKPVKNSPYPRNYYRCTTDWCDVKKRVERSFSDPSSVITTYEGQHTHDGPLITSKRRFGSNGSASGPHFPSTLPPRFHQLFDYNNHQQQHPFPGTKLSHDDDHVLKKSRTRDLLDGAGLIKEHGLLQDVVLYHIIKEE